MLFVSLSCACAGSRKPVAEPVDEGHPADIMDEPIPEHQLGPRKRKGSTDNAVGMLLPETPSEPTIGLDGDRSDWPKAVKLRRFDTKQSVEEGASYWKGKKDASMQVAVHSDDGFLYFWIEVADDTIVPTPMQEKPNDGILLWLRDPGLDAIGGALPSSINLSQYIDAETAILFLPNGRVEAWGAVDDLDIGAIMRHETVKTKTGYAIELALKVEAFEEISAIPLPKVAFRVELLDGDDGKRPGVQTKLSTTPDDGDDAPRFATFDVGFLLPHAEVGAPPPRENAIGRWKVKDGRWEFVSFEIVPKYWKSIEGPDGFSKAIAAHGPLEKHCADARKDVFVIESYESKRGKLRTGLVLCGQRAVSNKCPANAESRVLLVSMIRDETAEYEWVVDRWIDVFQETLPQCTWDEIRGEPVREHMALFPLDVLAATVWVVGWTRTLHERGYAEEQHGVTLLSTKFDNPHLGSTVTRYGKTSVDERVISTSSTYLTYVDDDDQVDICQRERLIEQACTGFDRGCVTYERGESVLTHIQMWSKKKRRFETYELSKHKGCNAEFDFSRAPGYLILQVQGRVGLLPSPKSNADADEDRLDLF